MDIEKQVKLAKSTKHIHSTWYRETYPEVAELGLDPVTHFILYGAAMGRNPGKNFNTQFYLDTYPEVRKSKLNPLVHYALHGQQAGYATRPQREGPRKQINVIRTKLLSLGFTERPLAELTEIATISETPEARAMAARELALWHMRAKTEADYRTALDWIAHARPDAPDLDFRSKLSTVELLCHYHLNDQAKGLAAYDRAALAGEATPDLTLARVNYEQTPENRVLWINQVLARYGIEPVTLLPDEGQPAYDRLTCAVDLPKVTDGPKVTVLIAAYDAAAMLPTALRSLQEQTWQNLEIIVLDDCSPTPDTVRVAEEFAARDPRIQVVQMEQNGGAYVARNRGLDMATGDFVTIHDADDWSHPQKIETQAQFLIDKHSTIGCKSQQARAFSDLGFTRWTGQGQFIIPNTSSFMFRRAPVREHLGYWDTVRFSADNELVRRIRELFGRDSVNFLPSGPLSFQRDSNSSIVADDVLGVNGFMFGARKEYLDAQNYARKTSKNVRYVPGYLQRPFPAPALMQPERKKIAAGSNHINVITATDLRIPGGSIMSTFEELYCAQRHGISSAIFELNRYDAYFGDKFRAHMLDEAREVIWKTQTRILTYGEKVTCDLLILRYPPTLQERQRYIPKIEAKEIKVIINQPPMSDYSPEGVVRYKLDKCAENIRYYFGKDATWHPIGPLVRDALHTHHADQLHHINLSDQDWHNIIDINGWDRGPRQRGARNKLRIGRHSRDHTHKWPDTAQDILAAYPEADDVEVHVLGGAKAPTKIIGHTPHNWTVHEFGSMHPRDFLRGIDVWVYFANSNWVESFGRTIIEAMAVGVPVILPELYRPLFKDSVLYATPKTAIEVAKRLHADSVAYKKQVELAKHYAKENFSYEMHITRLKKKDMGPKIPKAAGKVSLSSLSHIPQFEINDQINCDLKTPTLYLEKEGKHRIDYLWQPNLEHDRLFVLFSGNAMRSKNDPPVFQRWSWSKHFPGSCLYVSDPSLYLSKDIGLAWYSGADTFDPLVENGGAKLDHGSAVVLAVRAA